jgi:hypothetical protein
VGAPGTDTIGPHEKADDPGPHFVTVFAFSVGLTSEVLSSRLTPEVFSFRLISDVLFSFGSSPHRPVPHLKYDCILA